MNSWEAVERIQTTEGCLDYTDEKLIVCGSLYVESTKIGLLWLKILAPFPVYIQKATLAWNLQGFAEKVCKPQYQTSLRGVPILPSMFLPFL